MARVQVLSTPGCAGCDALKRMLQKVLAEFPGLDWEELDLVKQPELAERYGIVSVPAVVIDGTLAFASIPKEDVLRQKLAQLKGADDVTNQICLEVEGMSCSGCESNLRFALSSLPGVQRAKADFRAKSVEVTFDPALTAETELRRTIENIGYTVVG